MSAKPIYSSFHGSFASYVKTLARLSVFNLGIVSCEYISPNYCGWNLSSSLVNSFPQILADERVSFGYNSAILHQASIQRNFPCYFLSVWSTLDHVLIISWFCRNFPELTPRSTEFFLLLFVCVNNSGSSPDHLSILRKFSRANSSFSGIFRGWGDQLWTFSDFAEYSREEPSILRTFC